MLSRSVVFDENSKFPWKKGLEEDKNFIPLHMVLQGSEVEAQIESIQTNNDECSQEIVENKDADGERSFRSRFNESTPVKLKTLEDIYARCNLSIAEPESYSEAAGEAVWQKAMKDELEMIEKNDTWELVGRPSEKPVIGVK